MRPYRGGVPGRGSAPGKRLPGHRGRRTVARRRGCRGRPGGGPAGRCPLPGVRPVREVPAGVRDAAVLVLRSVSGRRAMRAEHVQPLAMRCSPPPAGRRRCPGRPAAVRPGRVRSRVRPGARSAHGGAGCGGLCGAGPGSASRRRTVRSRSYRPRALAAVVRPAALSPWAVADVAAGPMGECAEDTCPGPGARPAPGGHRSPAARADSHRRRGAPVRQVRPRSVSAPGAGSGRARPVPPRPSAPPRPSRRRR